MNTEELIQKLNNLYGPGKGMAVYATIMPGILSDFRKMLSSAAPGKEVREEYRLEDGKGVILMIGSRDVSGNISIDAILK